MNTPFLPIPLRDGVRPGAPSPMRVRPERNASMFSRRCLTPVEPSSVAMSATPSGSGVHPRPGTPTSLNVVRIEGSPIERISAAMGAGGSPTPGGRPHNHTVAPVYSLRIFARHKEGSRHMARVTPITARQVDLLMDLQEAFHELATRDGHIDTTEAEVAAIISMVLVKAERIDRTRRIARNLEDSGEMTPWALRNVREMEHDLGNIVRFEDYRQADQPA